MKRQFVDTKVLITVMTYPHPSQKHQELVCTAGVTDTGEWVRLYPIDYRYLPNHQKFRKYQWIKVGLLPRGSGNDNRKESREPDLKSIEVLGPPLTADHGWLERCRIIDKLTHNTKLELESLYDTDRTSLGIVRPSEVVGLKIEPCDPDWKPEWQAVVNQFTMFSGQPKALKKLPYKFSYQFRCSDSGDKVHSAMIEDWELGVLFLKEAERLRNDDAAAQSVRKRYLDDLCHPSKDVRFFMGTIFPYNTWVVIGIFWPPKLLQPSLF